MNRRKGINRAEKSGIIVRKVEGTGDLDQCYDLTIKFRRLAKPCNLISNDKQRTGTNHDELTPTKLDLFFVDHFLITTRKLSKPASRKD